MLTIASTASTFKDFFNKNKDMESSEDIISKLKFIGKIQKGDKINVKSMFVQPESLATRLSRSFVNMDCRGNTLTFVKNTLGQSFNILYTYLNTGSICQKSMCLNIVEDIQNSKEGIKNLKVTYGCDIMLCCQLDTLLQEIDAKISELSEKYPDLVKSQNFLRDEQSLI
jgi:hypothetical protein